MKTAVEWLLEQLDVDTVLTRRQLSDVINQAKKMEKEQMIEAFTKGDIFGADYFDGINITAENYYNQTFKIEQDGKWK